MSREKQPRHYHVWTPPDTKALYTAWCIASEAPSKITKKGVWDYLTPEGRARLSPTVVQTKLKNDKVQFEKWRSCQMTPDQVQMCVDLKGSNPKAAELMVALVEKEHRVSQALSRTLAANQGESAAEVAQQILKQSSYGIGKKAGAPTLEDVLLESESVPSDSSGSTAPTPTGPPTTPVKQSTPLQQQAVPPAAIKSFADVPIQHTKSLVPILLMDWHNHNVYFLFLCAAGTQVFFHVRVHDTPPAFDVRFLHAFPSPNQIQQFCGNTTADVLYAASTMELPVILNPDMVDLTVPPSRVQWSEGFPYHGLCFRQAAVVAPTPMDSEYL